MSYIISNNQKGQNNNANSSPVTVSSDQLGDNKLATDESLILLRRIVKLLESNAVVDAANRQRVIVEGTATVAGTVNVGTVTTVTAVSNVAAVAGYAQQQYIDIARNAYANGIRSKLNFS
jgi:hypothetical protein